MWRGHAESVTALAFSPDGRFLASGSTEIKLWRVSDGHLLRTLRKHQGTSTMWSLTFSPDGKLLASADQSVVRLLQVQDGSLLQTLKGKWSWANAAFSSDGNLLATGDAQGIKIWRVQDGCLVRTLRGQPPYFVAFSPDGQLIASASYGTITLWRVQDGSLLWRLKRYPWLSSLAFSPDGQLLASGDKGGIKLWRVRDRIAVRIPTGHQYNVCFVAFSPDGQFLASREGNGAVKFWRIADGTLVWQRLPKGGFWFQLLRELEQWSRLPLHPKPPLKANCLAFSPDGKLLAIGFSDGTIRLWRVSSLQR